jgi:hypothetical protein
MLSGRIFHVVWSAVLDLGLTARCVSVWASAVILDIGRPVKRCGLSGNQRVGIGEALSTRLLRSRWDVSWG